LEYHNGTVWPHDSAICAEGMRRYGFRDEAGKVAQGLVDAAEAFSNQLPEVFAGFARDDTGVPVEYPDALKPQSWAAAAPLLALRTLLGIDVGGGRLCSHPAESRPLGKLRLKGIEVRGRRPASRNRATRSAHASSRPPSTPPSGCRRSPSI